MVHNLGPKWLRWWILGGPRVVVFLHTIYDTLIDTSDQLMSQRHRIVPPGVSSSDTIQTFELQIRTNSGVYLTIFFKF